MNYILEEVYESIQRLLDRWELKNFYWLQLRQDQLEIWSLESDSQNRLSPCRFLITPTDLSLTYPPVATPEFYIDFATADESYTYKWALSSSDNFVKRLIVLREGERNFGGLIHRSDKGFPQEEFAKRRRQ